MANPLILLAGRPGFEPGYTESESVVLPLNDPPAVCVSSSIEPNETSHVGARGTKNASGS